MRKHQYISLTNYGSLFIRNRSSRRTVAILNCCGWLARLRSQLMVILFLFKKLMEPTGSNGLRWQVGY